MENALVFASRDALPLIERELQRDPRVTSENSRRAYRGDLAAFEAWRQGRPLTKLLVEAYAAGLREMKYWPYTTWVRMPSRLTGATCP